MIDVQARLSSTGRCFVSPEENIKVVTFAIDIPRGYKRGQSIWLVYDDEKGVRETPERERWVSTDGYTLFYWIDTLFRDNGKERYGPSKYQREHDTWAGGPAWIPNETHPLKCVGYLLSFDEVRLNRSKGLHFDTLNGSWVAD
jgi:hypothetical protein